MSMSFEEAKKLVLEEGAVLRNIEPDLIVTLEEQRGRSL